jgi:CheY-like chemotaxis protein
MARVLTIDDDRSARELLRLHLISMGHSVTSAPGSMEGIQALLDGDFDLVISDIDMPYLDGLELLQAIRGDEKTSHVPVILLTRLMDDDLWLRAMKCGATQYLTKPVELEELACEIRKALKPPALNSSRLSPRVVESNR